jgi:hypothetical protein
MLVSRGEGLDSPETDRDTLLVDSGSQEPCESGSGRKVWSVFTFGPPCFFDAAGAA